jgi:cytochrome c6
MKKITIQMFVTATAIAVVFALSLSAHAQNAAATYKAKCAGCHGSDGKGGTAPGKALGVHDFASDEVTKMSDDDLIKIVTTGKNKMPAYGKSLKDSEIKDLVAYVRQLGKQK